MKDGKQSAIIKEIIKTSNIRVPSTFLKDEDRIVLVTDILNRISNAKTGMTIKNYRSNNLTRVNDVKFRTKLAVLSVK